MVLQAKNIKRYFKNSENINKALDDVTISVSHGEFVAIMGESGSGKTTLLNCLASIDKPDCGSICFDGTSITELKDDQISKFRSSKMGFVFQEYNLLSTLTVQENMELPLSINGFSVSEIKSKTSQMAKKFHIENLLQKYPNEISGGEKQRCACARAIIHEPKIVFADEPTGALDHKNSIMLLEVLKIMNCEWDTSILMVTHDITAASYADRIVFLMDGKIKTEMNYNNQKPEEYKQLIYNNIMY